MEHSRDFLFTQLHEKNNKSLFLFIQVSRKIISESYKNIEACQTQVHYLRHGVKTCLLKSESSFNLSRFYWLTDYLSCFVSEFCFYLKYNLHVLFCLNYFIKECLFPVHQFESRDVSSLYSKGW